MGKLSILIVDDHALVRDGLTAALEREEDMVVIGEAGDAESAIRLAAELKPDVILMDLQLPGRSGVEATREIVAMQPSTKVIALTMHHDERTVHAMIHAGAQGYILKDSRVAELLKAIRAVAAGSAAIDPVVAVQVLEHYRRMSSFASSTLPGSLSASELNLLRLLAAGDSNRTLAIKLSLSEQTIKNRLSGIYKKLGVKNRAEAVASALQHGVQ